MVRARAANRSQSILSVLAQPGLPDVSGAQLACLRHWATCPLPEPADAAVWAELCRLVTSAELRRRTREGLL